MSYHSECDLEEQNNQWYQKQQLNLMAFVINIYIYTLYMDSYNISLYIKIPYNVVSW